MGNASEELVDSVAEAMGTFDALIGWYLDLSERTVLEIRNGQVLHHPELTPDEVDADENRFLEVPAATTPDEHDWLQDFQEAHGSDWPHIRVDRKKGANQRFLKSLRKSQPAAVAQWDTFRREHLVELAREWLAGVPAAP